MSKGMGNILKQAQQMQARMAKVQEELAAQRVEAAVGGGMVTVTANGQQHILSITVHPEVIRAEEREMLQDLLLTGVNEALRLSRELAAAEMSKATAGMGLPGMP